jgi:hypothetical protein
VNTTFKAFLVILLSNAFGPMAQAKAEPVFNMSTSIFSSPYTEFGISKIYYPSHEAVRAQYERKGAKIELVRLALAPGVEKACGKPKKGDVSMLGLRANIPGTLRLNDHSIQKVSAYVSHGKHIGLGIICPMLTELAKAAGEVHLASHQDASGAPILDLLFEDDARHVHRIRFEEVKSKP